MGTSILSTREGYPQLVLTRRLDQTIVIGDPASSEPPIEISVMEVRGDQVRLGVKAPRDVSVHRREIWDEIKRENREASGTVPSDVPALGNKAMERR